jgi:agmatinase
MGPGTFARLPKLRDVERWDVRIVGGPFDTETSCRSGQRFGPMAISAGSRRLRSYHPALGVAPFHD